MYQEKLVNYTTNGDIISMGWFPYPSTSGADQFYAFFYDAEDEDYHEVEVDLNLIECTQSEQEKLIKGWKVKY